MERLDPQTLELTASTPRLPGGAYWPGGIAAHANGDLYMVFGRWAHRLSAGARGPRLAPPAGRAPAQLVRRPRRRRTGDEGLRRATGTRALHLLGARSRDAATRRSPASPRRAIVARLASDGESVIAVGTTVVFRLRLDREAGRLVVDESWRPSYGPAPGRSYGWDPVITDEHVFWMDNGRNHTDRTMLGSGVDSSPVRLWWARRDDDTPCARSRSAVSPMGPSRTRRAGTRSAASSSPTTPATPCCAPGAWRATNSTLWRRDGFAHAGHLILYPDTRELVVRDWRRLAMHAPAARAADRPCRRPAARRIRRGRAAPRFAPAATSWWSRSRHRRRQGAGGRAVPSPGIPLPRPRLRPRPLLPVADHDRAGGGRLTNGARQSNGQREERRAAARGPSLDRTAGAGRGNRFDEGFGARAPLDAELALGFGGVHEDRDAQGVHPFRNRRGQGRAFDPGGDR